MCMASLSEELTASSTPWRRFSRTLRLPWASADTRTSEFQSKDNKVLAKVRMRDPVFQARRDREIVYDQYSGRLLSQPTLERRNGRRIVDCGGRGRVATDITSYSRLLYRLENQHDVVIMCDVITYSWDIPGLKSPISFLVINPLVRGNSLVTPKCTPRISTIWVTTRLTTSASRC